MGFKKYYKFLTLFCAFVSCAILTRAENIVAKEVFIENDSIKITVSQESGVGILDKKSGVIFSQLPSACQIKNISKNGATIGFDIQTVGIEAKGNIEIKSDSSFELKLSSNSSFDKTFQYPPAWKMALGDRGYYPIGNGCAFPVDMPSIPLPKYVHACAGVGWSMSMFGVERKGTFLISAIKIGNDALIMNQNIDSLAHTSIGWLPEKGKFSYDRVVRYFVGDSLAKVMGDYRAWRASMGFVRTLKEKSKSVENISKLLGAADVWIWDDNLTNRLYGRPEKQNVSPRIVKKIADQMVSMGMTKILWNTIEGESAEDCQYLKSLGFLVGKYDIYRDVLPANIAYKIIKSRVERSVNTKYWPDIVRIDEKGEFEKAWKVHGTDGKMYDQHAVCEISALWLTKKNVSADLANVGYNCRFIDVQATTEPKQCYSPVHPTTRTVSVENIRLQQKYLASIGLVNGVECGQEIYVATYDWAEGLLSPSKFRLDDAGRRMTDSLERSELPARIEGAMLNPQYRVPLWELVYHDCAVNYWYWGVSSCCCPEIMYKFDLFDALYGYPPIYSLDVSHWDLLKNQIAASYKRATKTASLVGFEPMVDFVYLTADMKIQKTTFGNGISVIANFSDSDFVLSDGTKIASWDYVIKK